MTDTTNPPSDASPPDVRTLLLELTTFDNKMVSGHYLAQRAASILALQQAAEQEGGA